MRALDGVKLRALALARALAGFLRGFVGVSEIPAQPDAVCQALEDRCARRRSCC